VEFGGIAPPIYLYVVELLLSSSSRRRRAPPPIYLYVVELLLYTSFSDKVASLLYLLLDARL